MKSAHHEALHRPHGHLRHASCVSGRFVSQHKHCAMSVMYSFDGSCHWSLSLSFTHWLSWPNITYKGFLDRTSFISTFTASPRQVVEKIGDGWVQKRFSLLIIRGSVQLRGLYSTAGAVAGTQFARLSELWAEFMLIPSKFWKEFSGEIFPLLM